MRTAPAQSLPLRRQLNRFLGGVMLGLIGLFVVLRLPSIQAAVLEPWSVMLADLAAWTLGVFGKEVAVSGTILRTSGLSLNVTTDCSGLEVIGVYVALTLACQRMSGPLSRAAAICFPALLNAPEPREYPRWR